MYRNAAKQDLDALVIEMIIDQLGATVLSTEPNNPILN